MDGPERARDKGMGVEEEGKMTVIRVWDTDNTVLGTIFVDDGTGPGGIVDKAIAIAYRWGHRDLTILTELVIILALEFAKRASPRGLSLEGIPRHIEELTEKVEVGSYSGDLDPEIVAYLYEFRWDYPHLLLRVTKLDENKVLFEGTVEKYLGL